MKEKTKKFQTNTFYFYASEYRKNLTSEDELGKIDMTNVFWAELETMIKDGEIIIININAKVRTGKSTEAFAIGKRILEKYLVKYGYQKEGARFGLRNIARDNQEYSKLMREPKTAFTVIVTDEDNELENTGENVTVERALMEVFSSVQAGRYVHRICCSPKETVDANADIMLSITSIDKTRKMTHNKLYYRFYEGGQEFIQLLGYVDIYVGDIIGVWEDKVKKHFYKPKQSEMDKVIIEKYRKTDWYTEYVIKKHEKMELITKEGIFKPRILDYAEAILEITERLKKLTKIGLINANIVRNYIKMEMRKRKIPTSIVGEELATREAMGILDIYKSYFRISREIMKIEEAMGKGEIDITEGKDKQRQLIEMREEILNSAKIQEEELQRYKEINKKYHEDYEDERKPNAV